MKIRIFGMLLLMESLFMAMAMAVSLWYGEDDWRALFVGAFASGSIGGLLFYVGRQLPREMLSRRDCYMVVALVWVVFSMFGLIPYMVYGTVNNITDAFFETMSGFTTTGASILNNIDEQPHGILFWRSLTQWMGGLGIVVFSFALIPAYELRNTNMFSAETTGLSVDKLRPKIAATSRRLLTIYAILTLICAACYWYGDIGIYDSICHAMTTIATGGFSTHQSSMAYFHSEYIEYMAVLFMFISGINFSLFYYASIGRYKVMLRNEELRWYTGVVIGFILLTLFLYYYSTNIISSPETMSTTIPPTLGDSVRSAMFHVVSIITSSGFQSEWCDYVGWGAMFWMPTIFLMVMGACAGSTGGGIKIIRLAVVVKDAMNELKLHIHPSAVLPVNLGDTVLPEKKIMRALAFVLIYIFIMCVGICLFSMMGMDWATAVGSGVSMLSNTGPGMGNCGPMSNYAECMPIAKWLMSMMMLIGRLEIFTVLFLFVPDFWRNRV